MDVTELLQEYYRDVWGDFVSVSFCAKKNPGMRELQKHMIEKREYLNEAGVQTLSHRSSSCIHLHFCMLSEHFNTLSCEKQWTGAAWGIIKPLAKPWGEATSPLLYLSPLYLPPIDRASVGGACLQQEQWTVHTSLLYTSRYFLLHIIPPASANHISISAAYQVQNLHFATWLCFSFYDSMCTHEVFIIFPPAATPLALQASRNSAIGCVVIVDVVVVCTLGLGQ